MSNAQSKPITVRFSQVLTKLIDSIVTPEKKNPSDFIREAVEEKAYAKNNNHRTRVVPLLMEPKDTVNKIRETLNQHASNQNSEKLSLLEKSAFLVFVHGAYSRTSGYVNPGYVLTLLDMTHELFAEAVKQQIPLDFSFYHSRLDIQPTANHYEPEFSTLKQRFLESPSAGWAECLLRPISDIAFKLDQYDYYSIDRIFSFNRMQQLLPVAIKGVDAAIPDAIIARDMRQLLPDYFKFKIGGLSYMISAEPFCVVVEDEHHCYAFKSDSLISLILFSINDYAVNQNDAGPGLTRSTFEVQMHGEKVIIHEHNGYRLHMSSAEFHELRGKIKEMSEIRQWQWMFDRFRNLKGDI